MDFGKIDIYDMFEMSHARRDPFFVRSPINTPVCGADNEIAYIIHRVEDVTEYVHLKQKGVEEHKLNEALRERAVQMDAEIYARSREIAEVNLNRHDISLYSS